MVKIAGWVNRWVRCIPTWPVYALGAIPAGLLFREAFANTLGADPVRALEHEFGELAFQLLIASLCITPLRHLTGISLIRFRRSIGLMAFFYAVLHLFVWLWFDRQLEWARILADLLKRPYIIAGMAAFLALAPLAATSSDFALRRMGTAAWARLHRLVYPAAVLAALHYIWLVKAWPPEPMVYAAMVAVLLLYRVYRYRQGREKGPVSGLWRPG